MVPLTQAEIHLNGLVKRLEAQGQTVFDVVKNQTVSIFRHFLESERCKILTSLQQENASYNFSEEELANKTQEVFTATILDVHKEFGHVLLHNACLRGSLDLVYCLLEKGADPNATNDAGETPMHYAARRGNVVIMDFLYQAGAKINLLDNKMRHCSHHAAAGGQPPVLQWLEAIEQKERVEHNSEQISYHNCLELRDSCNITPLYLACEFGHRETVAFLLKRQNSIMSLLLSSEKSRGNTCLHAAILKGHHEVAYLFYSQAIAVPAIHKLTQCQNNDGKAPMEVLEAMYRQESKGKSIMSYFLSKESSENAPMKKSIPFLPTFMSYLLMKYANSRLWKILLWSVIYLTVCWPLLLSFITVFFTEYLLFHLALTKGQYMAHENVYSFLIYSLTAFYLYYNISHNSHRIHLSSRSPNPIFLASFLCGMIHTAVCAFFRLQTKSPGHLMLLSWCSLAVTIASLLILFVRDPGWASEKKGDIVYLPERSSFHGSEIMRKANIADLIAKHRPALLAAAINDIASSYDPQMEMSNYYCHVCEHIFSTNDVKHCKLCECCVTSMDHHCLFIMRCVANNNMRLFAWFCIFTVVCIAQFLYLVVLHYSELCTDTHSHYIRILYCAVKQDRWLFTISLFNLFSLLWGVAIIYFQLKAISLAGGTYSIKINQLPQVIPRREKCFNIIFYMFLGKFYVKSRKPKEHDATVV